MADIYTLGIGLDTQNALASATTFGQALEVMARGALKAENAVKQAQTALTQITSRAQQAAKATSQPFGAGVFGPEGLPFGTGVFGKRAADEIKLISNGMKEMRASADKLVGGSGGNDGLVGVAKQFGFLSKQVKEFSKFGATVFAGDILSRTLGFGSVMGVVSKASELVANGIRAISIGLRDYFIPEIKAAAEASAKHASELERLIALQKELDQKAAGDGFSIGGRFFGVSGLGDTELKKFTEEAIRAAKEIEKIDKQIKIITLSNASGSIDPEVDLVKLRAARLEELKTVEDLTVLLRTQSQERKEIDSQAEAYRQREIEFHRVRTELFREEFKTEKALTDLRNTEGREAARQFALANRYSRELDTGNIGDVQIRRDREAAQRAKDYSNRLSQENVVFGQSADPIAIGNTITSAFASAATIIARAFGGTPGGATVGSDYKVGISGSERDTYGAERAAYVASEQTKANAAIWAQHRADQLYEEYKFNEEKIRIAEEAQALLSDSLGRRIADGFEDAIFSGQKLSEVLRNLQQDLARMAFKHYVTNNLANLFGNVLNGNGFNFGGGQQGTNSSTWHPPMQLPDRSVVGGGGGRGGIGSLDGGFRMSDRQRRQSFARGR